MTLLLKFSEAEATFWASKIVFDRIFEILTLCRHSSLDEDTFTHQWRQRDWYTISNWHTTPHSVSCTRVPWAQPPGGQVSSSRSGSWRLFSVDETIRVCALSGWTKTGTKAEYDLANDGPIPRTGENWPASLRVATLIDIRRWGARMCRTDGDAAPRCGSGRRGALKGHADWSAEGVNKQLPAGEKVGRSAGKWQW